MAALAVVLHTNDTGGNLREFSFEVSSSPEPERPVPIGSELFSRTFWNHAAVLTQPFIAGNVGIGVKLKATATAGSLLAAVPFTASVSQSSGAATPPQLLTSPWHSSTPRLSALSASIVDAVQHCMASVWRAAGQSGQVTAGDADSTFLVAAMVASWWTEVFLVGCKAVEPATGPDSALQYLWGLPDALQLMHHASAIREHQPDLAKKAQHAAVLLQGALEAAAAAVVKAAGAEKWSRCLRRWLRRTPHCSDWVMRNKQQASSSAAVGDNPEHILCLSEHQLQQLYFIVHGNAHPLSTWVEGRSGRSGGGGGLAMIPGAAFFNHSSHPNAVLVPLADEGRAEVRACRDIAAGEPVSVAYTDTFTPPQARNKVQQDMFFFKEDSAQYVQDLMAAYAQRPFGRELTVALHAGESTLGTQPRETDGALWGAADPSSLAGAMACPKCYVGGVLPCTPALQAAPAAVVRRSVAGQLCSLLTLSAVTGSIKPRSGPNVSATPPSSDTPAGAPQAPPVEFLPALPWRTVDASPSTVPSSAQAQGCSDLHHTSADSTSVSGFKRPGRCVFCGAFQDLEGCATAHSQAERVLKGASAELEGGHPQRCLSVLEASAAQEAFVPLHFYNRMHFDRLLLADAACTSLRNWRGKLHVVSRALHMLQAITPAPSVQSAVLHGSQASALLMLQRSGDAAQGVRTADVVASLRLALREMDRSTGPHYPLYARLQRALEQLHK